MAIEFPLGRVLANVLDRVRDEVNYIIRLLEVGLRVEDQRVVVTYEAGWSDGSPEVMFYKAPDKRVHVIGFADHAGPALPDVIFTLPEGYRPAVDNIFWIFDQVIEVHPDGTVELIAAPGFATPPGVNLTGISFLADA